MKNKDWRDYTKEEMDAYRHQFIKSTLRRASYRWPWRNLVAGRARVSRGLYECAICKLVVRNKDKVIDHIRPVVSVQRGFRGWNTFAKRLFCKAENFQVICRSCHKIKTDKENQKRKALRHAKKGNK